MGGGYPFWHSDLHLGPMSNQKGALVGICEGGVPTPPHFATPEVLEECNDFPKEIPFLVDELECEEVVFDECVEVSEKIPVEVRISSECSTL